RDVEARRGRLRRVVHRAQLERREAEREPTLRVRDRARVDALVDDGQRRPRRIVEGLDGHAAVARGKLSASRGHRRAAPAPTWLASGLEGERRRCGGRHRLRGDRQWRAAHSQQQDERGGDWYAHHGPTWAVTAWTWGVTTWPSVNVLILPVATSCPSDSPE